MKVTRTVEVSGTTWEAYGRVFFGLTVSHGTNRDTIFGIDLHTCNLVLFHGNGEETVVGKIDLDSMAVTPVNRRGK